MNICNKYFFKIWGKNASDNFPAEYRWTSLFASYLHGSHDRQFRYGRKSTL